MLNWPGLPIEDCLPQLKQGLSAGDEVVLEAPPGAGKTTLVPLALVDEPCLAGRKILMLEPRRIAPLTGQALADTSDRSIENPQVIKQILSHLE